MRFSRVECVVKRAQSRQNRRAAGGVRVGMTARITGSLVVCAAAAAFTAGALIVNAADDARPVSAAAAAAAAPSASSATVVIKDFTFTNATVRPGASVTVTNRDGVSHTVTADANAFNTGPLKAGASVTLRAPTKPGTYMFFCAIHPNMKGTLVVK
jgi:plastocyanin